jgi:hypothetical protein
MALLVTFLVLSRLDWTATSYALTTGHVSLHGPGPHEGNPVTVWLFTQFGSWAYLVFKLALFVIVVLIAVGLSKSPWRETRWIT